MHHCNIATDGNPESGEVVSRYRDPQLQLGKNNLMCLNLQLLLFFLTSNHIYTYITKSDIERAKKVLKIIMIVLSTSSRHKKLNQCWFIVGPPSTTLDQP